MLGVLSRGEVQAEAPLSCGVSLGEWEERVQQLEVVSSVLWENLTFPATAHFRYSPHTRTHTASPYPFH